MNQSVVRNLLRRYCLSANGSYAWWAAILIVVAVVAVVDYFANDNNPDTKVEVRVDGESHRIGN
ncbi:hypothetical protein FACS1894203_4390 [Bacteroidia bacterium]|nr:hypothetical protein FACS1894203_4390 [Bacteroidia bacterium]